MARPPRADAARTRANVLACASRLFSAKGVAGTPMREIARAAGVTQATVHHYFGSKEELHDAVVASMYGEIDELREQFTSMVASEPDVDTLLDQAIRGAFRFVRAHVGVARMVMREVLDRGELDSVRRRDLVIPFVDEAAQFVAIHTGQKRTDARMVLLSLNFLVIRYSLMSDTEMIDFVGGRVRTVKGAEKAVEDHLIVAARDMLRLKQ